MSEGHTGDGPPQGGVTVVEVDFDAELEVLRRIRETVFIEEQNVSVEEEWDGRDPDCVHVLARATSGEGVGTGRLLPDGHIGRMAVLREWRGRGVGSAVLTALMEAARRRGFDEAVLSSQTAAIPFYERHGFVAEGDVYMDAGIPHRDMRRKL